ncbi:MAG: hypothetical protein J6L69_10705 [Lachnospiraceae bacterium]|nr:hypothetical protein [Lachnospiraceae bacterium]
MKKRFLAITMCVCMMFSLVGCNDSAGEENTSEVETVKKEEKKAINIVISPDKMSTTNDGKFQGWGTSLCWWANRLGYSDELASQAAELFFGEDGLKFNIMRYNIGGGDDPTHKHITRTDSAVPGWLVYDEASGQYVYDYEADKNQLNVLKKAVKAAGEDAYVEVFSNSPPYFMTESGCSSGNEDAAKNNLKKECYSEFAEYLAHVTKYINDDLGIKVSSVSPMNEPNTDYWGANSPKQEGCHVDPGEAQSSIIVETAKAFKEQGLVDVEIIGSDETAPDKQVEAYNKYSEEALAVIDRISTHTYYTNGMESLANLSKQKGFNLWMSEVDGDGVAGVGAGEMSSALWMAGKIIEDINGLSPSAWVMWQVIDNHVSKEGYNGNKDSGMVNIMKGFWGAAVANHDANKIILTQKYYAIGQFSRYIRPGATIIHVNDAMLAAYDSENKELVIVAVNAAAKEKQYCFDLSEFASVGESAKPIRTSGSMGYGESWAELEEIEVDSSEFSATLKGNSITTFVISDVEL